MANYLSNPSDHSLSSSSTSESFCLSTDSDFEFPHVQFARSNNPTTNLKQKPISAAELKPDTTIYSFAWSNSSENCQEHLSREKCEVANGLIKPWAMSASGFSGVRLERPQAVKDDNDLATSLPPPLPRPVYWSTLTQPELFKDYIASEALAGPVTTGGEVPSEPFEKSYSNLQSITSTNANTKNLVTNASLTWIDNHLFADNKLPAPFVPSLLLSDAALWKPKDTVKSGVHTFASYPNLLNAQDTMNWLNHFGNCLGILHGLVVPPSSSPDSNQKRGVKTGCEDRAFNCEGSNKPFSKGLVRRKPDIVVIDRTFRHYIPTTVRLRWPLVQALVEITSQTDRSPNELIKTILDKASNVFDSQLHRRYVIGLGLMGKGEDMQFFLVLVDRAGATCTKPVYLRGYGAMTFARIIYGLTFGDARLIGADPKVRIDHLTGDAQGVFVDNQFFTIVAEVYVSPLLFSRGTRVYIVKDDAGQFHIFKDSWILASHKDSEITHIKNISQTVEAEAVDDRTRLLSPRFIAGEDNIDNTDEPRGLINTNLSPRIRRRIVTGPIGDPITTFRSRVECLQCLIDVVDRKYLIFFKYRESLLNIL